jgi:hypothetical protein
MGWLSESITIISQFAIRHGTVAVAVAVALSVALWKLFENLPSVTESIYRRRAEILRAKQEGKAAQADGKVNRIRALTDRKAARRRLKDQSRIVRQVKNVDADQAVRLINAIHVDPDLPQGRRLSDEILGEIYTVSTENDTGTPPGSPGNVRQLRDPGPTQGGER